MAVNQLTKSQAVDYILIESSGIAQPDLIAKSIARGETILGEKLKEFCRLDTLVSVVDAFRLLQQFTPENGRFNMEFQSSNQVIINQIECCDVLLFNKIDLISPEEKKYLLSLIRQIQPHAKIVESTFCQFPISHVLNTHLFDEKTSFRQIASHLDNSSQIEKELAIQSFVYCRREPFHPERFDAWLNRWPKEIIRCKGVVWFVTQPNNAIKISQSGRAIDTSHSGYWIASLKQWEVEQMMKIRKIYQKSGIQITGTV